MAPRNFDTRIKRRIINRGIDRKPATGKNFGFQKQYLHVGTCTLRLTILPARIPPLSCFEQTHLFEDYFRRISLYDLLNTFTTRERVKWHNFNTVDQKSDTLKINNRWNMIFRIPGEKEGELYRWKKERKYIYIFIFNPRSTGWIRSELDVNIEDFSSI